MSEPVAHAALRQAGKALSAIPVGLREAALDSPTFRATAVHFSDQVEIIEQWLDAYLRATSRLVNQVSGLEETINSFLARSVPPANVSEAVLDHDYTLLAMKRFGEGSREWWSQSIGAMKKMEENVVVPIRAFLAGEGRNFKDARKYLDQSQKTYDSTLSRYLAQSKFKEASSLREDAFQVHEARKSYLKASLDFCMLAPQLRITIDRLLVKVSWDQWREMKRARENTSGSVNKWNSEMDRVRGWSKELDAGESVFRNELQKARREIAEHIVGQTAPSRELEDYGNSTVPFLGSKGPSTMNVSSQGKLGQEKAEKQGWLFQRTLVGKPARHNWIRRWYYVKNGIFGWLRQGQESGGVEESEKIGVLLCNVRPAIQEERRFCFEVKTKNNTILVQAETQKELVEWLEAFEIAKTLAMENNTSGDFKSRSIDPAFAITPASVPEFAAKHQEGHGAHGSEETGPSTFDRSGSLPVPAVDNLALRNSVDVPHRRSIGREEGESSRDHAARIIQKLDLHRKTTAGQQLDQPQAVPPPAPGGIASLISASHNILPVSMSPPREKNASSTALASPPFVKDPLPSTLAPTTLANPPAPTNLSKSAIIIGGERGISIGRSDASGGMQSGMMANLWGSNNWGYINRLERSEDSSSTEKDDSVHGAQNMMATTDSAETVSTPSGKQGPGSPVTVSISTKVDSFPTHRKTLSTGTGAMALQVQTTSTPDSFPSNYPLALKTQEAQFRMLFPDAPRSDKLVLVFRASWNPNEQHDFPGRVYVTAHDMYFYSHHLGLILISGVSLESIEEVTAAPGKDCDFMFLHLRESARKAPYSRITIKTFLEPLRLLQTRLNYLIDNLHSEEPLELEPLIDELIRLESDDPARSPSLESWEDVDVDTPFDDNTIHGRRASTTRPRDLRRMLHIERGLHTGRSREVTKFQLPSKPIVYEPPDMDRMAAERTFDISAKALFHVLFGDKSAVFQLLYHERRAQRIAQGPWQLSQIEDKEGSKLRREFNFQIDYQARFGQTRQANVSDFQVIDVQNDHVCYVVSDYRTPWHLPHRKDFMLVSKVVITHVAKSRCKLAIYTKVAWSKQPVWLNQLIDKQAFDDLDLSACDLADVLGDQVRKLGAHSKTKKAIQIFGQVGIKKDISMFSDNNKIAREQEGKRLKIKQRTLLSMVRETLSSFMESVMTSLIMGAIAVLKRIWGILKAERVILAFFAISLFWNLLAAKRDTSVWWAERSAVGFMKRVGVGEDMVMSKAVYLRDLDHIISGPGDHGLQDGGGSKCYDSWLSITNTSNLDAHTTPSSFSTTATRATARHLSRTRQNLGSYRHDLLVAMRVVNAVEREMLRAEWENWLWDENTRCRQLGGMLTENKTLDAAELTEIKSWWQEYCGSCRRELEGLGALGKDKESALGPNLVG